MTITMTTAEWCINYITDESKTRDHAVDILSDNSNQITDDGWVFSDGSEVLFSDLKEIFKE